MKSITLSRPNQNSFSMSTSNLTFVVVTALAFGAGIVTMVKPVLLLAIPAAAVLYGLVKFAVVCNEVRILSFDTDGVELSYQDILDELDM